jgi:hypothetical protein
MALLLHHAQKYEHELKKRRQLETDLVLANDRLAALEAEKESPPSIGSLKALSDLVLEAKELFDGLKTILPRHLAPTN